MRISKERKKQIAWEVANDWVEFAVRILDEGKKPVRFRDQVDSAVHQKLCEFCERKGDIEKVDEISSRVKNEIKKLSTASCRVQISLLKN